MSRITNYAVAEHWGLGISAINHRGSFHTDGYRLYSYKLLIGDTCPESGEKIIRDYTANGKWGFKSQTTSCHVGRARMRADIID